MDLKNFFKRKPRKLEIELKDIPAFNLRLMSNYDTKQFLDSFIDKIGKIVKRNHEDYIEKFSCKGAIGKCETVDAFLKVDGDVTFFICPRDIYKTRGQPANQKYSMCNVGSLASPEDVFDEHEDITNRTLFECPYAKKFE